jgi:hypothetical protein
MANGLILIIPGFESAVAAFAWERPATGVSTATLTTYYGSYPGTVAYDEELTAWRSRTVSVGTRILYTGQPLTVQGTVTLCQIPAADLATGLDEVYVAAFAADLKARPDATIHPMATFVQPHKVTAGIASMIDYESYDQPWVANTFPTTAQTIGDWHGKCGLMHTVLLFEGLADGSTFSMTYRRKAEMLQGEHSGTHTTMTHFQTPAVHASRAIVDAARQHMISYHHGKMIKDAGDAPTMQVF